MSNPNDARPPSDPLAGIGATDGTSLEPPEHEVEGAVPPGYDWPTHGGYLGCLVATIAACLLTSFIGANLFSFLYIARRWPLPVFALLTVVLFVGLLAGLGRLGWQLGKRFYRYYPQPRPTWGESDSAGVELTEAASAQEEGAAPAHTEPRDEAEARADEEAASPVEPEAGEGLPAQLPATPSEESSR